MGDPQHVESEHQMLRLSWRPGPKRTHKATELIRCTSCLDTMEYPAPKSLPETCPMCGASQA